VVEMAVITVKGLPNGIRQEKIEEICDELRAQTAGIREVDLNKEQIVVWFPPDRYQEGLGKEFSVKVEGLELNNLGEKGKFLCRNFVAQRLGKALNKFFPKATFIEVHVEPTDNWGVYSYRK
jgi:hypothetical protein